jgi:hypothetical protein
MINFEAVIRHFGQEAQRLQAEEAEVIDNTVLLILENRAAEGRIETVRNWLRSYQTFQGIDGANRSAIATAVLEWADSRDVQRNLTSVDALAMAHAELMAVCTRANGANRNFTSLASKALWLRYPESVPIFDSFTQRALWVVSKLETNLTVLPDDWSEYHKFAHIWKALYERYASALNAIDMGTYPFRVRVFDKILWLIGEPRYGIR